jgi:hypothetical protein
VMVRCKVVSLSACMVVIVRLQVRHSPKPLATRTIGASGPCRDGSDWRQSLPREGTWVRTGVIPNPTPSSILVLRNCKSTTMSLVILRRPLVFLAIVTTCVAIAEVFTWQLRVTTPAGVATWISLDLMFLPPAKALFTFAVSVVSLKAVAVPAYASSRPFQCLGLPDASKCWLKPEG